MATTRGSVQPDAEADMRSADAMLAAGLTPEALDLLQAARLRHPAHAGIARRWADGLQLAGRLVEAVSAYGRALQLDEVCTDAWYGVGCVHLSLQSYGAAAMSFKRACELKPGSGAAHYNLAAALFQLGRVEVAIQSFLKAARLDPALAHDAYANIACIVPGSSDASNESVLRARRLWADEEARRIGAERPRRRSAAGIRPPSPAPAWRIGYLSSFFGQQNWMKAVFSLINRHDRAAFEIHLLSDGEPPCARSGYRDHPSDVVHDIRGADNERLAAYLDDVDLDVLVDLNGYSIQSRLALLMRRPARHIVGWFNMFATTGIGAFDWIVGDDAVIPESEEVYYCERVYRLPGTYAAFEVLYPVPDVAAPPCGGPDRAATPGAARPGTAPPGAPRPITFGCLGSNYKFSDAAISAWGAILAGAPQAALFVKNAALEDGSTRADLAARLLAAGVDLERVTLQGRSDHHAFIDAYRHVDIALDTFPYNGGTTTMEALWQGVPVLAFDGDRWASRTSKSLLLAAGLGDWVLPDRESYVQRAVALANDPATPAMLTALRGALRARVARSEACNTERACRAMEAFYRRILGACPT